MNGPADWRVVVDGMMTSRHLLTCPLLIADARAYVAWSGSLPEERDAHVLHFWGTWETVTKRMSRRFRPCGPGHQYVAVSSTRALLRFAGALIAEVRRTGGQLHVGVRGSKTAPDVEARLLAALEAAASRPGPRSTSLVQAGLKLLERGLEIFTKRGFLRIESSRANAYRRLEVEMASPEARTSILSKRSPAGRLLFLPSMGAFSLAMQAETDEILVASSFAYARGAAPKRQLLREATSSRLQEKSLGILPISGGVLVLAAAVLSHHVIAARARNPVAAMERMLEGASVAELKVPQLSKIGAVLAVRSDRYRVFAGAATTSAGMIRWCRLQPGQRRR